jgi:hypothetical protein
MCKYMLHYFTILIFCRVIPTLVDLFKPIYLSTGLIYLNPSLTSRLSCTKHPPLPFLKVLSLGTVLSMVIYVYGHHTFSTDLYCHVGNTLAIDNKLEKGVTAWTIAREYIHEMIHMLIVAFRIPGNVPKIAVLSRLETSDMRHLTGFISLRWFFSSSSFAHSSRN